MSTISVMSNQFVPNSLYLSSLDERLLKGYHAVFLPSSRIKCIFCNSVYILKRKLKNCYSEV